MLVRNRKTGEEFDVTGARVNLFANKKPVDYSPIEQFLQELSTKLPANLPTNEKDKILHSLRKNKEISAILHNPKEFTKLIDEINKQMQHAASSTTDTTSFITFLKSLSSSLASAHLNSVFPGLGILANFVAPAAADSAYSYFQGKPAGGEDLCANTLVDCIQGYLTELGEGWNPDMPQVARVFENNPGLNSTCISQTDLENMLERAYRGPGASAANCSVSGAVENMGKLTLKATQVDPITCNLLADSTVGFADKCAPKPPLTPDGKFALSVGLVVGVPALFVFAFMLTRCISRKNEEKMSLNAEYSPGYSSTLTV
jgi:hypothetical protein